MSGYSLVSHTNPHTFRLTWKRLAVKSSFPSSSVFHDILPAADASAPNVTAIVIGRPLRVCVVNVSLSVALCQHSVLTAAQHLELTIHSNSRAASSYPDTPHLRAGAGQKGGLGVWRRHHACYIILPRARMNSGNGLCDMRTCRCTGVHLLISLLRQSDYQDDFNGRVVDMTTFSNERPSSHNERVAYSNRNGWNGGR